MSSLASATQTATVDATDGRGAPAPRLGRSATATGTVVRIVLLGLVNALVIASLPTMLDKPDYFMLVAAIVSLVVIDIVYLSPRKFVPLKYLVPGTLFLLVFLVYPILNTVYLSTTNYGTGNIGTKPNAITQIERNSVASTEDAPRYELQVLAQGNNNGPLAYLLTDSDGNHFLGTADGLEALTPADIVADGRRETIDGYVALNLGAANDRKAEIDALAVPTEGGQVENEGFTEARVPVQTRTYDAATNTLVDLDGTVFHEDRGYFVSDDGDQLLPGWRVNIGIDNYKDIFTDSRIRQPLLRVLVWTIAFSLLSVLTTFAAGLLLAMVFHAPMKGKRLYRGLIVIPYAVPSFMTALVWKGMFNQQFGVINKWLGTNTAWLDGRWITFVSILIVNLWLGYPYMFLVTTGALQGIPNDYIEAAKVDGASGFKAFRKVTFPLLLIAVAPLLIASFAFNFNNFNLIYLLSQGGPPVPGSQAGRTDILISYTYKLAFGAGGRNYGFAAAVSLLIFILVAGISAFSFRFTKKFEEMR